MVIELKTKRIIWIVFLFLTVGKVFAQSASENYVQSTTYKRALSHPLISPSLQDATTTIQYFDEMGRPIQENRKHATHSGTLDLITFRRYDGAGRLKSEYGPYSLPQDGAYLTGVPFSNYRYTVKTYDRSPLDRIVEHLGQGQEWRRTEVIQADIPISYTVTPNEDEIRLFDAGVAIQGMKLEVFFYIDTDDAGIFEIRNGEIVLERVEFTSSYENEFYVNVQNSESIYFRFYFEEDPFITGEVSLSAELEKNQSIIYDYQYNKEDDQVTHWRFIDGEIVAASDYAADELYKSIIMNEDGHPSATFTDKRGRTIAKRSKVDNNSWAETHYVYDQKDQLLVVIPPEATSRLTQEYLGHSPAARQAFLDRWIFRYEYDDWGRMTKKKVPGVDTVFFVYDQWDRLVLTQDGEQREQDEWLFTKYDALNRPVLTGIHDTTVALTQREMQAVVDAHYSSSSVPFYETLGGDVHGYTNVTYPSQSDASRYLSATYYDDYGFQGTVAGFGSSFHYERPVSPAGCQTIPQDTYCYEDEAFNRVKGQVTGTKVKILGTDQWINTVTHYDDRYRVIQTVSTNEYLGVNTRTSQLYNFPGWLLETYKSQTRGSKTLGLRQRYSYDHAGRLLRGYHELYDDGVGQGEVLLAENRYNELGELIEKNLHVEGGVPAQSIDYRYNIRGWLESINNSVLSDGTNNPDTGQPTDYFGMDLWYQDPLSGVSPVGEGN